MKKDFLQKSAFAFLHRSVLALSLMLMATPLLAEKGSSEKVLNVKEMAPMQDTITVTGSIVDNQGEPLVGVSVAVDGTTIGTLTNFDGAFSIKVPNANSVLTVSYLGYHSQKIKVEGRTSISITLLENAEMLEEVVVTALGMSREKKALGYSMTELKGDDLLKSNVVNPVNALQGKVAGVQINMGNSGPQSTQRILIRGNTSISGNNQPVFVIDGIIIDNDEAEKKDKFSRDFGNDIKNLNSDDFETVSVLKGAAATALYGSRAANGVILITTKKGKKGEGLGINFSHTQQWESIYSYPDMQNEFGIGTYPAWSLNADGSENRSLAESGRSFGPKFDGKPYSVGAYDGIYQAYENNIKKMYDTGRYVNTNVAISGGSDKGTFRFSYSNLTSDGMTFNNSFDRNSFSLNATQEISKIVSTEAGFSYVNSRGRNPTYQGGDRSPVYDFSYSVPRGYDTDYWMNNYWSANHDGYNGDDPFGYSGTLFDLLENNEIQKDENYRAYLNVNFKLTDWLTASIKTDMNRVYQTYQKKTLATDKLNYKGAEYKLDEEKKLQYKVTGLLTASHRLKELNLGINGSVGAERFHERQSYHRSQTNNELRIPGKYELNNSRDPATTKAFANINQRRMNSVFGLINFDWANQVYLDITGRNDWSSTLMYSDGTGNVSYFYPSVSSSWLIHETFRQKLPEIISFAKVRASYAIVGKDPSPYLITDPGRYKHLNSFKDDKFSQGAYPYFEFANKHLGARDLKPEKQHAVEVGVDFRVVDNRFGIDFAYYQTNTKNQILALESSQEAGISNRIVNAGDIQNSGIEVLLSATPIRSKDLTWDMTLSFTRNKNKIKTLYPGSPMYKLKGGVDNVSAWATVGGAYGDIYSPDAAKRDENGNKLLNAEGKWQRAQVPIKIGSMQPKFLAGFTSNVQWKGFNLSAILDARVGGDIYSGSYNYGRSSGTLKSSLYGRTQEYGGLPREISATDSRIVHDGMIPDGVFDENIKNKDGVSLSGMTYQEAYDKKLMPAMSAYYYYDALHSWGNGIKDASMHKLTWVALREVSLYWDVPKKWTNDVFVKNASVGFVVRNLGYLYNSLPDNIHPEGLRSSYSSEFAEAGGNVYSRTYSIKVNLNF